MDGERKSVKLENSRHISSSSGIRFVGASLRREQGRRHTGDEGAQKELNNFCVYFLINRGNLAFHARPIFSQRAGRKTKREREKLAVYERLVLGFLVCLSFRRRFSLFSKIR